MNLPGSENSTGTLLTRRDRLYQDFEETGGARPTPPYSITRDVYFAERREHEEQIGPRLRAVAESPNVPWYVQAMARGRVEGTTKDPIVAIVGAIVAEAAAFFQTALGLPGDPDATRRTMRRWAPFYTPQVQVGPPAGRFGPGLDAAFKELLVGGWILYPQWTPPDVRVIPPPKPLTP